MIENEPAVVLSEIRRLLTPHADVVGQLESRGDHLEAIVSERPLRISAQIHNDPGSHPSVAHAHILVESDQGDLNGYLDACTVGIHADREAAWKNAAKIWFEGTAGPIFSLFHARPVLGAEHFDGSQPWGVSGTHGFAGPLVARLVTGPFKGNRLSESPLFSFAAELAPPGTAHLAKATLTVQNGRWQRTIEVDGHLASYVDGAWDGGVPPPVQLVASRFATFHYAHQPDKIEERRALDTVIRDYVEVFGRESTTSATFEKLVASGKPTQVVDRVDHFLTLALGRSLVTSQLPIQLATTYHRVLPTGELLLDLPLMAEPAFARGMALSEELVSGEHADAAKALALCSAEVNAINQLLKAGSKLENCRSTPFLIPDFGTRQEVLSAAVQTLHAKVPQRSEQPRPWWKFW